MAAAEQVKFLIRSHFSNKPKHFDTTEDYVKSILTKTKGQITQKNDSLPDELTVFGQNNVGKASVKMLNNVGKDSGSNSQQRNHYYSGTGKSDWSHRTFC